MLLPLFFAAHVIATAVLIPLLEVKSDRYYLIPWIFAAATAVTLVPGVRRQMTTGRWYWRLSPVLLYGAVITLASSVAPRARIPVSGNVFHPVEYAGLAFLAQYMAHAPWLADASRSPQPTARSGWMRPVAVLVGCVAFGALDELHQALVPRRACSLSDVGMDALGSLAGSLLFGVLFLGAARLRKTSS